MALRRPHPVLFLLPLLLLGACSAPEAGTPTLIEVVDGDTIVVRVGHHTERLRLIGLDTPESVDPSRPVQCFGPEASDRLRELLPDGTALHIERDVEARDRYGRLLGYVFRASDGLFVNAALLAEGYGDLLLIAPNTTRAQELEAAATSAGTANRGLWSACGGPDEAVDPPPPAT